MLLVVIVAGIKEIGAADAISFGEAYPKSYKYIINLISPSRYFISADEFIGSIVSSTLAYDYLVYELSYKNKILPA